MASIQPKIQFNFLEENRAILILLKGDIKFFFKGLGLSTFLKFDQSEAAWNTNEKLFNKSSPISLNGNTKNSHTWEVG